MLYFYVTFTFPGGDGSTVIKQHEGPDGLNLASVHQWLARRLRMDHLVVQNYHQISEKRFSEMQRWYEKQAAHYDSQNKTAERDSQPQGPVVNIFTGKTVSSDELRQGTSPTHHDPTQEPEEHFDPDNPDIQ